MVLRADGEIGHMGITLTRTRFASLGIRCYRNATRVGVPGHRKPFQDSWVRFVDLDDDADIGPSFHTKAEALAALADFARERGYAEGRT